MGSKVAIYLAPEITNFDFIQQPFLNGFSRLREKEKHVCTYVGMYVHSEGAKFLPCPRLKKLTSGGNVIFCEKMDGFLENQHYDIFSAEAAVI
jgi:hypothetical protein